MPGELDAGRERVQAMMRAVAQYLECIGRQTRMRVGEFYADESVYQLPV